MKKFLSLALFLFTLSLGFFSVAKMPTYASGCERISGTFSAENWTGGTIHVACNGDNPPGPSNCTGNSKDLAPGDSFDFPNCSCLETAQGGAAPGCLSITNIPAGCVATSDFGSYCGANGDYVPADIGLSCPKPAPACNQSCAENKDCEGAQNSCTQCLPDSSSPTGKSCKPPETPVSPPDNTPACNSACTTGNGDRDCAGAKDSCTSCISGSCQRPPAGSTPVPTSPPTNTPACNSACTTGNGDRDCAGAKDSCTACVSGKCQKPPAGSTPVPTSPPTATKPPTATATPAFNENWCTCDGLETNPASFFPGDNVAFLSYGKVEAPYLNRAKVESMSFYVYRGNATTATKVGDSGPIASALDSSTSTKNRYKSTWSYKIPTDIKQGEIFRVQSKVKCAPQNVLGAAIKFEPTLIDRIVMFVGYMFGLTPQPVATDYQSAPVPSASAMAATPEPKVLAAQNSLQIGTFTESKIIEKSCSIVRFKFGN